MEGGPREREREEEPATSGASGGGSSAESDGVGEARIMAEAVLLVVARGSAGGVG